MYARVEPSPEGFADALGRPNRLRSVCKDLGRRGRKRDTAELRCCRGSKEESVEIRGEGRGSRGRRRAVRKSRGVPKLRTRRAKSRTVREREDEHRCSTTVSREEVVSSPRSQVHSG